VSSYDSLLITISVNHTASFSNVFFLVETTEAVCQSITSTLNYSGIFYQYLHQRKYEHYQSKCHVPYLRNTVVRQMKRHRQNVSLDVVSIVYRHQKAQLTVYKHTLLHMDYHHTTTVLRLFFRDHPGELVPEENFWTLCASDSCLMLDYMSE